MNAFAKSIVFILALFWLVIAVSVVVLPAKREAQEAEPAGNVERPICIVNRHPQFCKEKLQ